MDNPIDWPLSIWCWPRQPGTSAGWTAGHVHIKFDGCLWQFRPRDISPERLTSADRRRIFKAIVTSESIDGVGHRLSWRARVSPRHNDGCPTVELFPLVSSSDSDDLLRAILAAPSQTLPHYCPTCHDGALNCSVYAARTLVQAGVLPASCEPSGRKFFFPGQFEEKLKELAKTPGAPVLPGVGRLFDGHKWVTIDLADPGGGSDFSAIEPPIGGRS